jgi:hypothetical protein
MRRRAAARQEQNAPRRLLACRPESCYPIRIKKKTAVAPKKPKRRLFKILLKKAQFVLHIFYFFPQQYHLLFKRRKPFGLFPAHPDNRFHGRDNLLTHIRLAGQKMSVALLLLTRLPGQLNNQTGGDEIVERLHRLLQAVAGAEVVGATAQ